MTITIHFNGMDKANAVLALACTIASIGRGSGGGDLTDPATGDLIRTHRSSGILSDHLRTHNETT